MSPPTSPTKIELAGAQGETTIKPSRYVAAGAPTGCGVPSCKKPFESTCVRGADDRYYCSEVCAQVGIEIDFENVANLKRSG